MLARSLIGDGGGNMKREIAGGDLLAQGKRIATLTTVGAGTITAAMIAAGILRRTGPVGGFTDTFATAQEILTALAGNNYAPDTIKGLTFEFLYINGVAQAMTAAGAAGITLGTLVDVASSAIRRYLFTILNATPPSTQVAATTSANAILTLAVPVAMGTITPGQVVSGTGITAGSLVAGVTIGDATNRNNLSKITAVTMDQVGSGINAASSITFSPNVSIDGLYAGTA